MKAKTLYGIATETIPFGASVIHRGFRVSLAPAETANGTARSRPTWCGEAREYAAGQHMSVDPIEGLGARDLHAIAAGPIMAPTRLYLPAGKLSKAEADAREASNWEHIA